MDSLIELKEHEDLSLADEADRNWTEILDQTYIFNRKRREVNKSCIVYVCFTQDFPNLNLIFSNLNTERVYKRSAVCTLLGKTRRLR